MEQFSLEKWLQDKSRKICTRDGRPVRIICWDKLDDRPAAKEQKIVALVKEGCKENVFMYNNNGDGCISALDLFFADEEELTEFESDLFTAFSEAWQQYLLGESVDVAMWAKEHSKDLLESAKKELEANYYTNVLDDRMVFKSELHSTDLQTAYDMGKQDALKDPPKWKKAEKDEELDCHVAIQQDGRVVLSDFVQKDEYYITLDVLKTLPKEE